MWRKAFESSYQTSLSTLTWTFRDDFSIPRFPVFVVPPAHHPVFVLTHPDQSVPRSHYNTPNRICQLLLDCFLSVFFRPDLPADFYLIFV